MPTLRVCQLCSPLCRSLHSTQRQAWASIILSQPGMHCGVESMRANFGIFLVRFPTKKARLERRWWLISRKNVSFLFLFSHAARANAIILIRRERGGKLACGKLVPDDNANAEAITREQNRESIEQRGRDRYTTLFYERVKKHTTTTSNKKSTREKTSDGCIFPD